MEFTNSIVPRAAEAENLFSIEFFSTGKNSGVDTRKEFRSREIWGDSRFAVKTEVLGEESR